VSGGPGLFFAGRILGLSAKKTRKTNSPGSTASKGGSEEPGRRYLRGAIVGVALSIVPLIVVLVVSDGMIQGITSRYIEVGTYHLQALPRVVTDQAGLELAASSLREIKGVSAFPELRGYGVAIWGSRTAGLALRAVDSSFLADKGTAAYLKVVAGEARLDAANQILLGESLAKNLGAKLGDAISVVTTRQAYSSQNSIAPKVSVFIVRGIVSAGYRELDALWAFVSLRAGYRILWSGGSNALVGVKIEKPYGELEGARASLRRALSSDWLVETWPEAQRNVYQSFSTTRALLLLVMALAVAVAAINVASALVMLVLERRKDIAILKSAGASPSLIGRIFVLAGLGVGGTGTLIGIAVGSAIAWRINDLISLAEGLVNQGARLWALLSGTSLPRSAIRLLDPSYYLERIPVNFHPLELAEVAAASIALCLLASLIPANRASRLPPLEIFRKT
jgi:lipoprotein-releasing system permease protein